MDAKIKSLLGSIMVIAVVASMMTIGTHSYYSDTETSVGNTFTAGTLDLKVDGQDGIITCLFSADNMAPGNIYNGGTIKIKNAGSIAGRLTVKVTNLISNENGLLEPEIEDGDTAGNEIDPTGYDANGGDGELWDQITIRIWVEGCGYGGAGSHDNNGKWDWDDTHLKDFGSTQDDYSSSYSIKLDTDLAAGKNIILNPGDEITLGIDVKFIDDTSNSWWGGQGSLTNNMAMSDDAQLDLIIGLEQV